MYRFLIFLTFVASAAIGTQSALVQAEHSFLAPVELARLDLKEAWQRQLSVPAGGQSIVDFKIHVHRDSAKQYVEVVGKAAKPAEPVSQERAGASAEGVLYARYLLEVIDGKEVSQGQSAFSGLMSSDQRRIGGIGRAAFRRGEFASSGLLDRAEAERRARNDVRRLKRRGIEAEIVSREVPRIRLYTLCDDGTVESRDAETGELVWLRRVGYPIRGYGGLGVNDTYLTVVNGGEMISIDTKTGSVFATHHLPYVAMRGAVQVGDYSIVPSIGSRIIAYPLADKHRERFEEMVSGATLAMPTKAIGSLKVAWGTSEGFVYVMELSGEPNIQFRLNTDGIVSGAPVAAPGERFYFGSEAGQIYGIRATREGEVLWSQPTGDPIYDSPTFYDEKVVFRSTYGNVTCVDAATGHNIWDQPVSGIDEVVGILKGRIFARTLSGSMVVLDIATGKTLHRVNGASPRVLMRNVDTDRIYLVNINGAIQCIRPLDSEMPTLAVSVEPVSEDEQADADDKKSKSQKKPADSDDPFGGGDDPFGGGGVDPFGGGGGADPFGGGGAAADPFAPSGDAGADPFGGSPF
ncbi:outer membrane protein assembly factor BamB family protein [Neorhodopirellula lusitana]|uniref:outer membrane protein assembly factor BamB family protein n=1 Tax=Neorhodopirellula lusitana TaxID=445327 RepID=UPI0038515946